jgi:membrane associated rhomboid family serine protease
MIPIGDVVPRRTRPWSTIAVVSLIGIGVACIHALCPSSPQAALRTLGAGPHTFPWPALLTAACIEPFWLAGILNIGALGVLGPSVEDRLGHSRFLLLLLLGAWAHVALPVATGSTPMPGSGGAAGAVAAVMGAYLLLFPESKVVLWMPGPGGGWVQEVPVIWPGLVWLLIVPGNLAQYAQPGPLIRIPTWGIAVAIGVGVIASRVLPPAERLQVAWWDECT